jgi:quercetin dioxygenase-like cupin family protein
MYIPNYYSNQTEAEIYVSIKNEGFNPLKIRNSANHTYSSHDHHETKLLAILEGSIQITVNNELFYCKKGDKIIIPGNLLHSAKVGPDGCTFFWSEKLM